jgi:hypothetical protein
MLSNLLERFQNILQVQEALRKKSKS